MQYRPLVQSNLIRCLRPFVFFCGKRERHIAIRKVFEKKRGIRGIYAAVTVNVTRYGGGG